MLRFKVNEPSKAFFSTSNKDYGIVAKRTGSGESYYSTGVLVRITDRQEVVSNIVHNYAEFGVEAMQRFRIEKVILEPDDGIVKVCEVVLLDDQE